VCCDEIATNDRCIYPSQIFLVLLLRTNSTTKSLFLTSWFFSTLYTYCATQSKPYLEQIS
jgi:hypothetical protein